MKLIIALAVSATIVISAFIEPANAQRRPGNKYGITDSNEFLINSEFKLFDSDVNGQFILDSEPSNSSVGLFKGAISGFFRGSGGIPRIERFLEKTDFDGDNVKLSKPFEIKFEEVAAENGSLKAELSQDRNSIAYSILDKNGNKIPLNLEITDYVLNLKSPQTNVANRLNFPNPLDEDKAVNNLSYILENNLLDYVEGTSTIVKLGTINSRSVPEPGNTSGFLMLAGFGIYSFNKNKTKIKKKLSTKASKQTL